MNYTPISTSTQGQSDTRLVFTFSLSPYLGYFVDAYMVNVTPSGLFQYDFKRLKLHDLDDFFPQAPDFVRQIIILIEEYDDKVLIKKFSKEKKPVKDYFKNLERDFIEKHIRPYIDIRIKKITDVLLEHGHPLHRQADLNSRIEEKPFFISNEWANPVFFFERDENESRYALKIFHQEKDINLKQAGTLILAFNPCILVSGEKILRFENISAEENFNGQKIKPFLEKAHISIPKRTEKEYFVKFIQKVVKNFPVQATGFDLEEIKGHPKAFLRFEKDWQGDYIFVLSFEYPGPVRFLAHDTALNRVKLQISEEDYRFVKVVREPKAEKEAIRKLCALGLKLKSGSAYISPGQNPDVKQDLQMRLHALDWIIENHKAIQDAGFQIDQNLEALFIFEKPSLQLAMTNEPDWFDIKAEIVVGSHTIPFMNLRHHILNRIREYKLKDGSVFIIPEEWFSRYEELMLFAEEGKHKEHLKLRRIHTSILESMGDEQKAKIDDFFEIVKKPESYQAEVPESLNSIMRPYQKQGFQWLSLLNDYGFGGCLADDMGLGKTLQTLALLLKHKDKADTPNTDEGTITISNAPVGQLDLFASPESKAVAKISTSLIVAPTSLIFNWKNEIEKFAPELSFYIFHGKQRKIKPEQFSRYNLIITTYGTIRGEIESLSRFKFHYLILDESQMIKNPESIAFQAVSKVKAHHKLVLTGTPIENSLSDLWSQFHIINPELLGGFSFFKDKFIIPIERQNSSFHMERLHKLISPFILRRTKSQVAKDLPELTILTHYCEMTEEQRSLYEEKKSELRNFIIESIENKTSGNKIYHHIFKALTQLRLIASHPSLISPHEEFESGKFMDVIMSMENLYKEGHKVLVFSSFVKHLKLFSNFLDTYGLKYSWLTGSLRPEERQAEIQKFQTDPDTQFFLISIKTGGTGLNLTQADYVFVLDPWFNPAVENQAIARAHRIGQDKNVMAYKFITLDTVEEKILRLQQRKSLLAEIMISESQFFKALSLDEIRELLE